MPFIDAGSEWSNAKEPVLATEGKYDLKIAEAALYQGKGGGKSVRVLIDFAGKPELARMYHYIGLADKEKDAKADAENNRAPGETAQNKLRMAKRFMHLFGIKWSAKGYDTNDFAGKTARADVVIDTSEMPDGTIRKANKINLPPLPEGKV